MRRLSVGVLQEEFRDLGKIVLEAPTHRKLLAEFLGTYLLVFTVGCNVLSAKRDDTEGVYAVISIGSVLMVSIYALGPISGANFNPAVTTAVCGAGKLSIAMAVYYILTQCAAGIIGALSFWALYGQGIPFGPNEGSLFSWYQVLLAEFLYTFMLCFVVLSTACCKEPNQFFGMAIGFVIMAAGNAAGWVSGGAFNPAVGLGLDVSDSRNSGFGFCLPYIVTQCFAGTIAGIAFQFIRAREILAEGVELPEWHDTMSKLMAEFIGTFFIVMTVGLNVVQGPAFVSNNPINETAVFSIASAVMVMVYAMGGVSGGHLNPAVTFAIYISGRGKISLKMSLLYMLSQTLAGLTGSLAYVFISGGITFGLGPYSGFSWLGVFAAEFVFTFLLTFTVLCVATLRPNAGSHTKDTFGLAIGFSVIAGGYAVSAISGAAFNPAVAVAIDVSRGILVGGFWHCVPYVVFEMLGSVAAALIFRNLFPDEFPSTAAEREELIEEGRAQDIEMQESEEAPAPVVEMSEIRQEAKEEEKKVEKKEADAKKKDEKAKKKEEEEAKKEADAKKKEDEKAKKEAEAKKKTDEKAKKEADEKAKKEAEAKKKEDEKAKKEADEKAKKEAEAKKKEDEKAKKEADEKAKKEAEKKE
eukprot:CAMPEP_0206241946 /NCGR_PEP_ID=MMETSP0047_2-20121206/16787_1 /ASSEMBLY_ACC=CAM_ASM_000192 /TAXON_ID=195065 /ORGANISM="Chroomonas mesostigmatica_cf, Strain CCMP1168" /LENGTH=638 /DNA_ID=CAMNT_0053666917 /DNA_START=107 /DNA_END=2020 /DNA_ORIENTATION=-